MLCTSRLTLLPAKASSFSLTSPPSVSSKAQGRQVDGPIYGAHREGTEAPPRLRQDAQRGRGQTRQSSLGPRRGDRLRRREYDGGPVSGRVAQGLGARLNKAKHLR